MTDVSMGPLRCPAPLKGSLQSIANVSNPPFTPRTSEPEPDAQRQGVGGHDHPRQFDPGQWDPSQEGRELGDLAAADRHKSLSGHRSLLVGECGQQMNPSAASAPDGASQRLAAHSPAPMSTVPECWVIQALIAMSNSSPSTPANARRGVASPGATYRPPARVEPRTSVLNAHCS